MIPNVASKYVSVVWKGYLMPAYNEAYTFYIEANDGVRVTINNQVVVDKLVDSVSNLDTHLETGSPITLQAGLLVPIIVQYY